MIYIKRYKIIDKKPYQIIFIKHHVAFTVSRQIELTFLQILIITGASTRDSN